MIRYQAPVPLTNGIPIEFEIRSEFGVLWFKICWTDQNEIVDTSQQCNCHDMCKILLWSVEYETRTLQNFIEFRFRLKYRQWTANSTDSPSWVLGDVHYLWWLCILMALYFDVLLCLSLVLFFMHSLIQYQTVNTKNIQYRCNQGADGIYPLLAITRTTVP